MLQRLSHGPATSGQLAAILTTTRPAASQHLAHLERAGLISSTAIGRHRWHELAPAGIFELEQWVRTLAETWAAAPTLAQHRQSSGTTKPSEQRQEPTS